MNMEYIAPQPTKEYKVLIKCMTYNQEEYVEDALKGFVRQKTDFPFCALVVDDCSTDGTAEIIKQYEQDYPDIIKGIYLPVNMYGNPEKQNYIKPWEERAQYIAYCEGDDYWIDDYKLQRQVDFLDTHPEYMMHFHNALVRYQNHNRPDHLISNFQSGDFDTLLLFKKWQLPLASVLFRRQILNSPLLHELNKVYSGGFCLFITATKTGKVFGLSECLSVYRINDGGVSNKMHAWDILDRRYKYAKVTKDDTVIKYVDSIALRRLIEVMPRYLIGNSDAKKLANVVKYHNKRVYYQSIIVFPFYLPKLVFNKIRTQYDEKKRSNR